jgi:CheY-like chemotaxis protein
VNRFFRSALFPLIVIVLLVYLASQTLIPHSKGAKKTTLSEVYGIVKRHRGHAEIASAPGAGTTIRLAFPRALVTDHPAEAVHRKCNPKRVLVVEDNDDGRDFMQALLQSDGHDVEAVATVREALERLTAPQAPSAPAAYDVLLTDIGLPDGSGWDLVDIARAKWPTLRIGVVTGWEVRTGNSSAANFTLRKPVRTHELLTRVAGEG